MSKLAWNDNDLVNWTPQAKAAFGYSNCDDGQFWISWQDFVQYFYYVGVGFVDMQQRVSRLNVEISKEGSLVTTNHFALKVEDATGGAFQFAIHQLDTRVANAKPYQRIGLLIVQGDGQQNIVCDLFGAPTRSNISEKVQLPTGTYELVPYLIGNNIEPVTNCTISVHSIAQYSLVPRVISSSQHDIKQYWKRIAEYTQQHQTQVFKDRDIQVYTLAQNGVVTFAVISKKSYKFTFTVTKLENLEIVVGGGLNPVTITLKPNEVTFVARLHSKKYYEAHNWSYNFKYDPI